MKNLKCVIVGYGRMGNLYHKILKELNCSNIYIITKPTKDKNKKNKNFFKDLKSFKKNNSKVDLAIISTTADSHKYYVDQFAYIKTKFIMVEKPISNSIININKMIKICAQNKSILSVNHSSRFLHSIKYIKKIIDKKQMGNLVSINVIGGNMGLSMNGVHFFEIFNYLTKTSISKVTAQVEKKILTNPRGKKFKDNSGIVIAKNKNNQYLYLNLLEKQGHGKTISFVFRNGIVYCDNLNGKMYISSRLKKNYKLKTKYYSTKTVSKFLNFKENLFQSTKSALLNLINKKDFVSAKEGLNSVKGVIAALESGKKNGKTVFVNRINSSKNFPWA